MKEKVRKKKSDVKKYEQRRKPQTAKIFALRLLNQKLQL